MSGLPASSRFKRSIETFPGSPMLQTSTRSAASHPQQARAQSYLHARAVTMETTTANSSRCDTGQQRRVKACPELLIHH